MRCTKVIGFNNLEPIFCGKEAIVCNQLDAACIEHKEEFCELNDIDKEKSHGKV